MHTTTPVYCGEYRTASGIRQYGHIAKLSEYSIITSNCRKLYVERLPQRNEVLHSGQKGLGVIAPLHWFRSLFLSTNHSEREAQCRIFIFLYQVERKPATLWV